MSKARNYAFRRRKIRRAINAGDFGSKISGRRLVAHKYGAGIGRATRDGITISPGLYHILTESACPL